MNIDRPVSTIMTKHLKTVQVEDSLSEAKEIFDRYKVHHVPVSEFKKLVGIISQSDLNHFINLNSKERGDELLEAARLRAWKVGEVMTRNPKTLKPGDSIRRALEIFRSNRFHALPIVDRDELVGIVTTFDILDVLLDEEPSQEYARRKTEFKS